MTFIGGMMLALERAGIPTSKIEDRGVYFKEIVPRDPIHRELGVRAMMVGDQDLNEVFDVISQVRPCEVTKEGYVWVPTRVKGPDGEWCLFVKGVCKDCGRRSVDLSKAAAL